MKAVRRDIAAAHATMARVRIGACNGPEAEAAANLGACVVGDVLGYLLQIVDGWGTSAVHGPAAQLAAVASRLAYYADGKRPPPAVEPPPAPVSLDRSTLPMVGNACKGPDPRRARIGDAMDALVTVRRLLDDLLLGAFDACKDPADRTFGNHADTMRRHALDVLEHVRAAEVNLEMADDGRAAVLIVGAPAGGGEAFDPGSLVYGSESYRGDADDHVVAVKWSPDPQVMAARINRALRGEP